MPTKTLGAKNRIPIFSGYALMQDSSKDVLTAARERVRWIFDSYDIVRVSFSGGKDSTCALNLCLDEAKRHKRLPLEVVSFDEEVYDPDTIAYMDRILSNTELFKCHWFCMPIRRHTRTKESEDWITWETGHPEKWVRPMPRKAITIKEMPEYSDKMSLNEVLEIYFRDDPRWACVSGIRMEESFNRRRSVAGSGSMVARRKKYDWLKPVYDWTWKDVWHFIREYNIDHSGYYDKCWMDGISPKDQRVAPWGGVHASRFVSHLPVFYPDYWEKACERIPGLKAQALYGNTQLYRDVKNKPMAMTWQEYCYKLLEELDPASRSYWAEVVRQSLKRWRKVSSLPFPDEPITVDGQKIMQSWKKLCHSIGKNDLILNNEGNLVSRDTL